MNRRGWSGLGIVGCLIIAGSPAAWAFTASFDQKVTTKDGVFVSQVWIKDEWVRVESTVGGSATVVVKNADGVFSFLPEENMAMRLPGLGATEQSMEGIEDYRRYLEERQAKVVGTETVNGYVCDVYEFVDADGKSSVKAWVWRDQQFPVKVEVATGPNGPMVSELSNIRVGAVIGNDQFALPPDVQVLDAGTMMGGSGMQSSQLPRVLDQLFDEEE